MRAFIGALAVVNLAFAIKFALDGSIFAVSNGPLALWAFMTWIDMRLNADDR